MPATANQAKRAPGRGGVAAVELAVCLPVIVVLVFAAIESCSMIFVTQALHWIARTCGVPMTTDQLLEVL